MRMALTLATLFIGITLALVSYFLLAAPMDWTTEAGSNPRVPFGAGIFVIGVLLTFSAAVVYELVPSRRSTK